MWRGFQSGSNFTASCSHWWDTICYEVSVFQHSFPCAYLASPWQGEDVGIICHRTSYLVSHACFLAEWRKQLSYITGKLRSAMAERKCSPKHVLFCCLGMFFSAWACKIKIRCLVMIMTAVMKDLFLSFASCGLIFQDNELVLFVLSLCRYVTTWLSDCSAAYLVFK